MPAKPGKRIPKGDVLEFVVGDILRQRSVGSQRELAELVNARFAVSMSGFRVSPERARLAALKAGSAMAIKTKRGKVPSKCPGCGRRLRRGYIKNLSGKNALLSLMCAHCNYEGMSGKWKPGRYMFRRI